MLATLRKSWFNCGMQKTEAIELLGGSMTAAAEAINISFQAVSQWPDVLPPRIADRVYAALARKAGALPELTTHITDKQGA